MLFGVPAELPLWVCNNGPISFLKNRVIDVLENIAK